MITYHIQNCNSSTLSPVSQSIPAVPTMKYFIALLGESLLIRLDMIVAVGEDEDGNAIVTLTTGREIVMWGGFSQIAEDLSKCGALNVIGKEQYELNLSTRAKAQSLRSA